MLSPRPLTNAQIENIHLGRILPLSVLNPHSITDPRSTTFGILYPDQWFDELIDRRMLLERERVESRMIEAQRLHERPEAALNIEPQYAFDIEQGRIFVISTIVILLPLQPLIDEQ